MKKTVIILSLMFFLLPPALQGQTENDTEILEFKLNNFYSIKLRQISESEFTAQKKATEHLSHKLYKVITDVAKAQKMLGKRIKAVKEQEDDYYTYLEVAYKGKIKKRLNVIWLGWHEHSNFIAYYPEFEILIINHEADGDYPVDLNDSTTEPVGNPKYYAFSPDKQFRINGYSPGGAADGLTYWLEKWNKSKKKYEFIEYLPLFNYVSECFWTGNSKVLFKYGWDNNYDIRYYEMEIITN